MLQEISQPSIKTRLLLAECLDSKEGMQQLLAELDSEGRETHAAIAFIATVIKEHGAVPASIDLYRRVPPASPAMSCQRGPAVRAQ